MPNILVDIIKGVGGWLTSAALLSIITYWLTHPEAVDRWISIAARAVANYSDRAEKAAVGRDIQARVNSFRRALNSESDGLLPHPIRVEWVKEETEEAFLKGVEMVVVMRHHTNQDRNLVTAAMLYVSHDLVPRARRHMPDSLVKSLDFTVVQKLLERGRVSSAIDHFFENIVDPAMRDDPEIRDHCYAIEKIDDGGHFTRILLRELRELGIAMHLRTPREEVRREVVNFLNFLRTIAEKQPEEDVPLEFDGQVVKVNIILIARPRVIDQQGHWPYVRRVVRAIRNGYDRIYICAQGWNVPVAKSVARRCSAKKKIRVEEMKEYAIAMPRRHGANAICIVCTPIHLEAEAMEESSPSALSSRPTSSAAGREGRHIGSGSNGERGGDHERA